MATATQFLNISDLTKDDYCVFGLAICFLKQAYPELGRREGELEKVAVLEPIPSAALEAIVKGIPTSYEFARAMSLGEVFQGDNPQIPSNFPDNAQLCENFVERAIAATRTYKNQPHLQGLIPLGGQKDDLNFSLEKKRILNAVHVVRTEDNVKQHSHTHKVL
ncbi:MAG: hypothetical protein ACKN87_23720 [Microcystis aeruginosa]